jgi:hypothetical protein
MLARGKTSNAKVIHHLAEWAFVEAIQKLLPLPENVNRLHLHRPSRGDAMAVWVVWWELFEMEDVL